ncbi:NusG domain II-containing protein [Mollicutes bacterium LVI A0039]|nr:NusG domain II-containing protein [Mollicutes bacterium LVI A0039]
MKQGIIFGILISIFSFTLVYFLFGNTNVTNLDIIIMQDGEEIFSTPLLLSEDVQYIWWIHEQDGEMKVLVDQEIIDYYQFDFELEELQTIEHSEYMDIYHKSGMHAEINMLINTEGTVKVIEANCPDKIDVKMGEISDTSKVITCAPHKLVIKLRNNGPSSEGELDG